MGLVTLPTLAQCTVAQGLGWNYSESTPAPRTESAEVSRGPHEAANQKEAELGGGGDTLLGDVLRIWVWSCDPDPPPGRLWDTEERNPRPVLRPFSPLKLCECPSSTLLTHVPSQWTRLSLLRRAHGLWPGPGGTLEHRDGPGSGRVGGAGDGSSPSVCQTSRLSGAWHVCPHRAPPARTP